MWLIFLNPSLIFPFKFRHFEIVTQNINVGTPLFFADEIKNAITEALITLPNTAPWKTKFATFGVIKFTSNSDGAYDGAAAQVRAIPGDKLNVRYY